MKRSSTRDLQKTVCDDSQSVQTYVTLRALFHEVEDRGWRTTVNLFYLIVLYNIWLRYPENPTIFEVREVMGCTKSNIRDAIKFWRERRILSTYPSDSRRTRVEFTEQGEAMMRRIHPHE